MLLLQQAAFALGEIVVDGPLPHSGPLSPSNQYQDQSQTTSCKGCSTGGSFLCLSCRLALLSLTPSTATAFGRFVASYLSSLFFILGVSGYYRKTAALQAKCEAGYRCPGSCVRDACAPGTYQPSTGAVSCLPWYGKGAKQDGARVPPVPEPLWQSSPLAHITFGLLLFAPLFLCLSVCLSLSLSPPPPTPSYHS